jgi:colanic acid biosynthesis protein WcaH
MNSDKFLQIIDATPLVSIDLVLEDTDGRVLLGKRINRPAQGYWFVPGGRIRKNESLSKAIERISITELGTKVLISNASLIGAYDHIYDDNFKSFGGINTHYVALAYKVYIKDSQNIEFDDQHSEMKWWAKDELLNDQSVHNNTKAYFKHA